MGATSDQPASPPAGSGPTEPLAPAPQLPPAQRTARPPRLWLRLTAWFLAVTLLLLAALSCVLRLTWFHTLSHPAGDTSTLITIEAGVISLEHMTAATIGSPTPIHRSIFNRQIQPGFTVRWHFSPLASPARVVFPFAAASIAALTLTALALVLRRRFFASPPPGTCPCGYPIANLHNRSARCPECGRPLPAPPRHPR